MPPRAPRRRRASGFRLGNPARRLNALGLLVVLAVTALGSRLVQLQGVDATRYASRAADQRLRTIVLPADRGTITDRLGVTLAEDVDARAIYADPTLVVDRAATAAALAPILGKTADAIDIRLGTPGRFVYLARGLTPAIGKQVSSLGLPGVGVLTETKRLYPDGNLAANIIGFTGADGNGLAGLEYAFDSELSGKAGQRVVEEDPSGRQIPSGENKEQAPVAGSSLRLTIDRDIQWMAQDSLARQVQATHAAGGTVIVMDPRTGDILAMATAPTYDLNRGSDVSASLLHNAAVETVYEPGSVNKVITAAAALETGVVTPDTEVVVPPSIHVAGRLFHDAERHGTEHLTFAGVLAKSSNIGTIMTAQKVGTSTLYSYLRRFGLGQPTGLGFPGESEGLLPALYDWSGTTAATIPIGQGVSATALQMASVYAAVANRGIRMVPRLVSGTVDGDGDFTPAPRKPAHVAISPHTALTLTRMLEAVTTDGGTAPLAAIPGYRIAGKTGTARRVVGGHYAGYVASFIGFAPADNPRLLVEVVLDNPRTAIYGGVVSAPVFHDVMGFALQSLKIPPTGRRSPVVRLTVGGGH